MVSQVNYLKYLKLNENDNRTGIQTSVADSHGEGMLTAVSFQQFFYNFNICYVRSAVIQSLEHIDLSVESGHHE